MQQVQNSHSSVTYVKEATPDTYQHAVKFGVHWEPDSASWHINMHMYKYSMIATVIYVEVNILWKWFGMIDNSEKFLRFRI